MVNNLQGFNTIRLLVKNVLAHPYDFDWTSQGLGQLRCYLSPEVRLHVWDRELLVPGASPLHTHPWDFDSLIVAGRMINRRYIEKPAGACPDVEEWNRVMIKCGEDARPVEEAAKALLIEQPTESYTEGDGYHQDAEEIHWSQPEDGTVTIVRRIFREDREHARVFWRGRGPWIDAKPVKALPAEITGVTRRALETWF